MRNYRPGMLVNWTSLYFFLVFFSFQLYFLGFCSLKSLKLNWYSFWNVYYIAYRIDSSQVEPFESCNSCSIFHLKKPKLITPQWIFIMHIKFAHTSSTHYDVAGDENRLWKWNSPYLKYFSKLQTQLGTYSIFILNTLYIKQIFKPWLLYDMMKVQVTFQLSISRLLSFSLFLSWLTGFLKNF